MPVVSPFPPIRLLPPRLADQIAAGEVIERPASVIKELVENSLDAHAGRIEIELHHGGMSLIRVADDGDGIAGAELPLAVCRHATSKIMQLDDLLNLHSLGFRGEALASICSVSEWEILSYRTGEPEGFRLNHLTPAAPHATAPVPGTTVVVQNLFYNTPARRKFLRSEQTEYRHCEEVIKRLALSRFDIGIFVQHNQRQTWRLPAATDDAGRQRRVRQLLGEPFLQHALLIDFSYHGMRLHGWLGRPEYSRQQSDLQFFYINGRIVRDRIINHAVRQAYHDSLPPGRQPAYVLYLEMAAQRIDVNVHPTKHEVRFHETRLIHDFLSRCLREALAQAPPASANDAAVPSADAAMAFTGVRENAAPYSGTQQHEPGANTTALVVFERYYLQPQRDTLLITDLVEVAARALQMQLQMRQVVPVTARPLLIPQRIELTPAQMTRYERIAAVLRELAFDLDSIGPGSLLLRALPARLAAVSCEVLLVRLLEQTATVTANREISADQLIDWILDWLRHSPLPVQLSRLDSVLQDARWLDSLGIAITRQITAQEFGHWLAHQARPVPV